MAVPKKKTSTAKKNRRRSHHSLTVNLNTCPNCKQIIPGHIVCPTCGFYAGKKVKETK